MDAVTQYNSPFFFLLRNSPFHSLPELMVCQRFLYSSADLLPELNIFGLWPISSSEEYPDTSKALGLAYSIIPFVLVIYVITGLCSTAWDNRISDSWDFLRSVISLKKPTKYIRSLMDTILAFISAYTMSPFFLRH